MKKITKIDIYIIFQILNIFTNKTFKHIQQDTSINSRHEQETGK